MALNMLIKEVRIEVFGENCHAKDLMECVTIVNELMTACSVNRRYESNHDGEAVVMAPGFGLDSCHVI